MNDTIASFLRHVITSAGAILTAKGVGDSAVWEAVGGVVLALVGFFLRKRKPSDATPVNQ